MRVWRRGRSMRVWRQGSSWRSALLFVTVAALGGLGYCGTGPSARAADVWDSGPASAVLAQLMTQERYIRALEARVASLESVNGGRESGWDQRRSSVHSGTAKAESRGNREEVDGEIWRQARDAVRSKVSSAAPAHRGGPGGEMGSEGRAASIETALRNAKGTPEQRIEALEKKIDNINVTSLKGEIKRFTDENGGQFDAGDTAWIIVSSSLVLLMTVPGLALFYGGLVRVQNVLSTVMQSFSIACLITVEWLLIGYSLSCTKSNSTLIYGGTSRIWLRGMSIKTFNPAMETVPEPIYCLYMLTFAIITPALICGSFADRLKFGPMLVFMATWHLMVYCPLSHAMWTADGFLHKGEVLDFAGGNVVHVAAGFSGLVCSIVVGKRHNFGRQHFHPHNILISVLGAALLWVRVCLRMSVSLVLPRVSRLLLT